jgi:hypothetical protein
MVRSIHQSSRDSAKFSRSIGAISDVYALTMLNDSPHTRSLRLHISIAYLPPVSIAKGPRLILPGCRPALVNLSDSVDN